MPSNKFLYGGQAVIEGVMIRGQRFFSVAVRRPNGELCAISSPLHSFYTGRLRRIPLVRGVIVLVETLVLGMRALSYSANVSLEQEEKEISRWSMGVTLAIAMLLGIGLFFLAPLFLVEGLLDRYFTSSLLSNFVEGVIRLGIFLIYIIAIGLIGEIRRVFAYHGAEHMTVHAREEDQPLEVASVRRYSTAHARCGTAFLLVVMVVAIIVFAFLGRPPIALRILSRVVLLPVIAGISYELIRFSGAHAGNQLVRAIMWPSLALQALTTRQPDDRQIEVAIHAMNVAVAADEGRELAVEVADTKPEEGEQTGLPSP